MWRWTEKSEFDTLREFCYRPDKRKLLIKMYDVKHFHCDTGRHEELVRVDPEGGPSVYLGMVWQIPNENIFVRVQQINSVVDKSLYRTLMVVCKVMECRV